MIEAPAPRADGAGGGTAPAPTTRSRHLPDWLVAAGLAALPLIAFWRLWVPNVRDRAFLWQDVTDTHYPVLVFIRDSIVHYGEFPLWAWGIYSGQPFASSFFNFLLYPLNWPFFSGLVDPAAASVFHVFLLAHFCIAAVTFYSLSRSFGHRQMSACLGASVYTFSGFALYGLIVGPNYGIAHAWTPLVLLCVRQFVRSGRVLWALAFSASLALVVSCLLPLLLIPLCYFLVAYFLVVVHTEGRRKDVWRLGGWMVVGGCLAFSVHAVELLPILEAAPATNGFGLTDYLYARDKWTVPTAQALITDFFLGGDAVPAYLGTLGGFTAMLALTRGRGRYWLLWAGTFLLCLLAVFAGRDFVGYDALYLLAPLVKSLPSLPRSAGLLYALAGAMLVAGAVDDAGWLRRRFGTPDGRRSVLVLAIVAATAFWMLGRPPDGPALEPFRKAVAGWALSLGLMALVLRALWAPRYRRALLCTAAILFVSDSASIVVRKFEPRMHPWAARATPQAFNEDGPPSLAATISMESPYLRGRSPSDKLPSIVSPRVRRWRDMVALVQGPDTVGGYYAWLPSRTVRAFSAAGFQDSYIFLAPQGEDLDRSFAWNPGTVATLFHLDQESPGRAWLVPRGIHVSSPPLTAIGDAAFDPRTTAYFETEFEAIRRDFGASRTALHGWMDALIPASRPAPPAAAGQPISAGVSLLRQTPNTVAFRVDRDVQGEFFVFSDTWYPGWAAYLNGRRVPLLVTDYTFKGVAVTATAGATLEFVYAPPAVRIGWMVTVASMVIALALVVLFRRTVIGVFHVLP